MSTTDQDLLRRWNEHRDAEAFRELTTRYSGMVYATCTRIVGNETDAEDVTQDCFEKLFQAKKSLDNYIGPWLHRVATNGALQHLRSKGRRQTRETSYADQSPVATTTSWDDVYAFVDEAMDELPEKLRTPVVMHFLEGESQGAIAETLGTSRSTISYRISNGLERVQMSLKKRGISVSATVLGTMLSENALATVPATLTASLGKLAIASKSVPVYAGTAVAAQGVLSIKFASMAAGIIALLVAIIGVYLASRDTEQNVAIPPTLIANVEDEVTTEPDTSTAQPLPNAAEDTQQNGVITTVIGEVTDVATDAIVEGLKVVITPRNSEDRLEGTTDEHGLFRIGTTRTGWHSVEIDDLFYLVDEPLHFQVGENETELKILVPAVKGGMVSGRAYDKLTQEPIANLRIRVSERLSATRMIHYPGEDPAATDSNGVYRIGALREGNYTILFDSDYTRTDKTGNPLYNVRLHNQMRTQKVSVKSGEITAGIDFSLYLGTTVTGIVKDRSGNPITDVVVTAGVQVFGQRATTRSDGTFIMGGVSSGAELYLHASGNGTASVIHGPYRVTEEGLEGVEILVAPAATIQGVLKSENGTRLKDAMVEARLVAHESFGFGRQYGHTDENGDFTIENLSAGEYVINAQSREKMDSHGGGESPDLATLKLNPGQRLTNVNLTLDETEEKDEAAGILTIAGRVTDSSGRPLKGASVQLDGLGSKRFRSVTTNDNGSYLLEELPDEEFLVKFSHADYSRTDRRLVTAGSSGVNAVLEDRVSIIGQVVVAETGVPVQHFEVFHLRTSWIPPGALSNEYVHVQDDEGRFSFDNVEVGPLAVVVRAEGYPAKRVFTEVQAGQTLPSVLVELTESVPVKGRVVNSLGEAVPNALVFLGKAPGNSPGNYEDKIAARSNASGQFIIETIPEEIKFISVTHSEYPGGGAYYESAQSDIEIILPIGGTLSGAVTFAGQPTVNIRVQARDANILSPLHQAVDTLSRENGAYSLPNLAPGELTVVARYESKEEGVTENRSVSARAVIEAGKITALDIDLPAADASIEGRVLSDSELPRGSMLMATFHGPSGDEQFRAPLDEEGGYQIFALPAGAVTLQANLRSKDGLGARTKRVSVETISGEVVHQDVIFAPGALVVGTLQGRPEGNVVSVITLPGNRIIADMEFYDLIQLSLESVASAAIIEGSEFNLEDLEPGTYTMIAYVMDRNDRSEMRIAAQATTILEVADKSEVSVSIQF